MPLDLLAEDFNVEKSTVMRGVRELKKLGLLRGFAIMVEEGNNTEKVESFIQIIGRYSEDWVEKATKITAKMIVGNPSRNFGYIVGILKRWDKQGHMD